MENKKYEVWETSRQARKGHYVLVEKGDANYAECMERALKNAEMHDRLLEAFATEQEATDYTRVLGQGEYIECQSDIGTLVECYGWRLDEVTLNEEGDEIDRECILSSKVGA